MRDKGTFDESKASHHERSRRSFLRRSMLPAVGAAAVGVTAREADAWSGRDRRLPQLYPGWDARNFQSIRQHENDHVGFIHFALGDAAFNNPVFVNLVQPNVQAFATLSRTLENTGVATYLGAAPLIFSHDILAKAASIALIEARHAGYLNTLLNTPIASSVVQGAPSDESFESPQMPMATAHAVAPFLGAPEFGMQLASAISTTPSHGNDLAILRFALLLEYLERDFYNTNVPRFFGGA